MRNTLILRRGKNKLPGYTFVNLPRALTYSGDILYVDDDAYSNVHELRTSSETYEVLYYPYFKKNDVAITKSSDFLYDLSEGNILFYQDKLIYTDNSALLLFEKYTVYVKCTKQINLVKFEALVLNVGKQYLKTGNIDIPREILTHNTTVYEVYVPNVLSTVDNFHDIEIKNYKINITYKNMSDVKFTIRGISGVKLSGDVNYDMISVHRELFWKYHLKFEFDPIKDDSFSLDKDGNYTMLYDKPNTHEYALSVRIVDTTNNNYINLKLGCKVVISKLPLMTVKPIYMQKFTKKEVDLFADMDDVPNLEDVTSTTVTVERGELGKVYLDRKSVV